MIEKSIQRIKEEMQALKASMPVSGSLVETYIVTETFIKTLPNKTPYSFTITFTPSAEYRSVNLSSFSLYEEDWASGPITSQYNPYSFLSIEGASQDNSGVIVYSSSSTPYFFDGDTFEIRLTASVYGTVPGTLSIQWS